MTRWYGKTPLQRNARIMKAIDFTFRRNGDVNKPWILSGTGISTLQIITSLKVTILYLW